MLYKSKDKSANGCRGNKKSVSIVQWMMVDYMLY